MKKEKLPYIKCKSCGYVFLYPRDFCAKCNSSSIIFSCGLTYYLDHDL
ncbi:zinc ribbon domain-containing protein [Saccharolobus islandicus]|nr:zinc ribbon domain-containing protein [Sulfolobus islandicus]PVU76918.1 hypothetical protein DDW12_08835 [Sulfolobus islandicus]WCM36460.1 hypothetical protein GO599_02260 [Sulfolobus islandicus]